MQGCNSSGSNAWIKIDLSKLDQTGLNVPTERFKIYMLGYASSSGQILQQDPVTNKITLGRPQPSDLTVPSSQFSASGKSVTLVTSANLFVGGHVTFSNGTSSTIASIAANVVCANQPMPNGAFAPYTNPTWESGANAVILGPASVNQGVVNNVTAGAQVTQLPAAAGTASGVGLGSLLNGYCTPEGTLPTAQAVVAGGAVTGLQNLVTNNGRYQYAPTVTFPGSGVSQVAAGTCTLDANGCVSGATISTPGAGYVEGNTYNAVFSTAPGNTYFLPADANGFPGSTSAVNAAVVTTLGVTGGFMTISASQSTDQPSWATQPPITLGSAAINIYAGGTNTSGYATLKSFVSAPSELTMANAVIADLPSTVAVQGYNTTLGCAGSSLVVEGVAGSVMIYSVLSFSITLTDAIPPGTTSLTFSGSVAGTVSATGDTLTISAKTYPGIASGLAIGQSPTITFDSTPVATLSVVSLAQSGDTITVTLSGSLPTAFQNQSVAIALPPTGGTLPVITWDSATNNAIWAEQLPGATGAMSVNGARIYFVLDTLRLGPPTFNYSVGVDANGNEVITVTQPPDALVWQGAVSPFQYIELTADALSPGDGEVYIDLSAVDGFFFPAALSATVNSQDLLIGQPWEAYPKHKAAEAAWPTNYAAVTRTEILAAWETFFTTSSNFQKGAEALGQAYAALKVASGGGIQNPSFAYSSPGASMPAFDTCWDKALDALFCPATGSNEVDVVGDLDINGEAAYYKGTQVAVGNYHAIQFVEYQGSYDSKAATGASFWVFDPRTPPPTEGQAFVQAGLPMSVGYQVFANTGVFASTAIMQGGASPNYTPGNSGWSAGDALKQLLALQRDIVTALNRGVGALGIGTIGGNTPGAGVTSTYWNDEANWYPCAAPYGAKTAQNLFAQWVHTAVIDASANKYYATYPFGSSTGYGTPAQGAGSSGPGTGPFMNQTYGFGYDETPNNAANVPAKFLPIGNQSGGTLSFQLVFGPWE